MNFSAVFPKRITEMVLEDGTRLSGVMPVVQASESMVVNQQTGAERVVLIMVQISASDYQKLWPSEFVGILQQEKK